MVESGLTIPLYTTLSYIKMVSLKKRGDARKGTTMDKLLLSDWVTLITTFGILVALVSNLRSMREKGQSQAAGDAELRSDVKHIREKIDKMDDIPGRMVKVEESTKQAHKRIDRVERELGAKE